MPVSTNFELIYDLNLLGKQTGDWPVRIVIKKNFASGTEETCTFVPESLDTKYLEPNDLMLVDWQGKLIHVGHIA